MNYCETIHDAYWEAIHIEGMLKRSHLRKAKMQEEKSPQTTQVPVVEPVLEIIKAEVEEQNQDTNDFRTNSDEEVQAPKEVQVVYEELKVVNQEPDQLVDFMINSILDESIKSLKE